MEDLFGPCVTKLGYREPQLTFMCPKRPSKRSFNRAAHTDFGMGGGTVPPIGGGPKGGDKGPMGGDWHVIRDKINGTKISSLNL